MDRTGSFRNFVKPHALRGMHKIQGERPNIFRAAVLVEVAESGESTLEPLRIGMARLRSIHNNRPRLLTLIRLIDGLRVRLHWPRIGRFGKKGECLTE